MSKCLKTEARTRESGKEPESDGEAGAAGAAGVVGIEGASGVVEAEGSSGSSGSSTFWKSSRMILRMVMQSVL